MTMITMMITTTMMVMTMMMMTMKMMIEMTEEASVAKKTHVQLPTAALQW